MAGGWRFPDRRRCGYFEGRLLLTLCRAEVDKPRLSATFLLSSPPSHRPDKQSIHHLSFILQSLSLLIITRSYPFATHITDLIPNLPSFKVPPYFKMQTKFIILALAVAVAAQSPSSAVSQLSDGQPQAPTKATSAVSQITDGQVQAPTRASSAVSQITDGQVQVPTKVSSAVSQITDGQVQAPTKVSSAVSQITDGQVQVPTKVSSAISQITDGQVQVPTLVPSRGPSASANGTKPTAASPSPFTGAGNALAWSSGMAVAGLVAVAGFAML